MLCKAAVCGLTPVLCCLLYCVFRGQSLGNIFLPNTACSDDIFYYKMVEGAVRFGFPQGYFGFNESRAVFSSFGAWSPMLLMPWILWGKIFGWGYFSPIVCNICILSFGFVVFAVLAEPSWKQTACMLLGFFLVTPFTGYLLSGMPETFGYSLILVVYGIVYSYFREEKKYKLALLFLLITILSLMRPYFMVFLLLPAILWMRRSVVWGMLGSAAVLLFNLAGYRLVTSYFTAPYFEKLMDTDFIDSFREDGFIAGCSFLVHKVLDKWALIRWRMSLGMRQGDVVGQIYLACCIAMLFLFLWLLADVVRLRHQSGGNVSGWGMPVLNDMCAGAHGEHQDGNLIRDILTGAGQLTALAVMLLAVILMYKVPEGSRHVLAFLVGFLIVGAMRGKDPLKRNIVTMAALVWLFVVRYDEDTGYRVPFSEESVVQEVETWSEKFSSCITLDHADAPNYGNVVAWVAGEEREVPWKVLFALPEGIGISCCLPQYMEENIDGLNSRYVITASGGQTDLLCQEKGMAVLLREESFVLYRTNGGADEEK